MLVTNLPLPRPPRELVRLEAGTSRDVMRWDCWTYEIPSVDRKEVLDRVIAKYPAISSHLTADKPLLVIGYLNAPREYFDGAKGPSQHHFHSRVGIALTNDLDRIVYLKDNSFSALSHESSIWTGCFVHLPKALEHSSKFRFFYTARDPESPGGMTQFVSAADTNDFLSFSRSSIRITPDPRFYDTERREGDSNTHAFRDPFVFELEGHPYMLVTAKSKFLPCGNAEQRVVARNGVIAVYRATEKGSLDSWEATSLCFASGCPEMEVPSIYWDRTRGEHTIAFSAKPDRCYERIGTSDLAIPCCITPEDGQFLQFSVSNLKALLENPPAHPLKIDPIDTGLKSGASFANHFLPRFDGAIVGFDCADGGLSVVRKSPAAKLSSLNNDFRSRS